MFLNNKINLWIFTWIVHVSYNRTGKRSVQVGIIYESCCASGSHFLLNQPRHHFLLWHDVLTKDANCKAKCARKQDLVNQMGMHIKKKEEPVFLKGWTFGWRSGPNTTFLEFLHHIMFNYLYGAGFC